MREKTILIVCHVPGIVLSIVVAYHLFISFFFKCIGMPCLMFVRVTAVYCGVVAYCMFVIDDDNIIII